MRLKVYQLKRKTVSSQAKKEKEKRNNILIEFSHVCCTVCISVSTSASVIKLAYAKSATEPKLIELISIRAIQDEVQSNK